MLGFVAHPLVEPSWLAAHLHDGDVRVVDARWRGDGTSRELHRQGHLPGAVHLDWQRDLSWTDERGVGYLLLPPEAFTPCPRRHLLALAREIEQALLGAGARVRLVDTRPREQYEGQAVWTPHGSLFLPSGRSWLALADGRVMRGGHIPGAVHLHASRLLNPIDWTYLSRESLRALAQGAGLEPEQRVITGLAGRASRPRWGSLPCTWPVTGT
jgi:3-mercaptopyruvate sulfurtransferase SseA